jgi:PAS domain S-box-containing protein
MDGIIHVINERGARLLGYSSTKGMAGSPVVNHVNGLDAHAVKSYFKRFAAAAGNYPLVENIVVLSPDKGQVPLELISSPYYERGRPYCMVQMMDISERKKRGDTAQGCALR